MRASWQHIWSEIVFLLGSTVCLGGCADDAVSEDWEENLAESVRVDIGMAVDADYSISVKPGRMTGSYVQKDGSFKGIRQLKLYGMQVPEGVNNSPENVSAYHEFSPVTISGPDVSSNIDFVANSVNSARASFVDEISLPIGTNRFVGYGSVHRPFGKVEAGEQERFFDTGVLLSHWNTSPDFDTKVDRLLDFYFGPRSIFVGDLNSAKQTDACRTLRLLNRLLEVKAKVNGVDKDWKTVAQEGLNPVLTTYYDLYTQNRAGAFRNVKGLMETLYFELKTKIPESDACSGLATAICSRILAPAAPKVTVNGVDYTDDLKFSADDATSTLTLISPSAYDFPHALQLPDGAAVLEYKSGDGESVWPTPNAAFPYFRFSDGTKSMVDALPVISYAYPAELLYRVDSPLKAAKVPQKQKWASANSWNDFLVPYTDHKLMANSKSIALEQPLRYMVGCLETRAYLNAPNNELPDASTGSMGKKIAIKEGGFPLLGILVGMQSFVGWDGKPRQTPSDQTHLQYAYYDCKLNTTPGQTARVTTTRPDEPLLYTLVLESQMADLSLFANPDLGPAEGKRTQQIVMLELENNTGQDFHGQNSQVISKGAHFYLLGVLNLYTEYVQDQTLPKNQQKFADPKKEYRVFEQGLTTTVTLKIESLAGAYNCIPDLRNPSLKISLSTDWNWQNGLIFDDNITLP